MKRPDSLTKFVLTFALLFPGAAALGYFVLAQDQWLRIVYSISKFIQFALPAVWCFGYLRESFSTRKLTLRNAVAGLKTGALFFTLTLVTYFFIFARLGLLDGSAQAINQKINQFGISSPLAFILMASYISVLHSFLEEYYWRWFVYRKLRDFISFPHALIISSVGFTLHHIVVICVYAPKTHSLILVPLASLAVALAGGIWAYQYERERSLWVVWLSHLLTDSALMVVGYRIAFGT